MTPGQKIPYTGSGPSVVHGPGLHPPTQKEMDMFKFLDITELPRTPAHRDSGSVSGAINAWELKNRALNTKGFVTCPKNYSEFLL